MIHCSGLLNFPVQIHFPETRLWSMLCRSSQFPNGTACTQTVRYLDGPVIFVGPDEISSRTIAGLCWVRGCVLHFLRRGAVMSSL